MNGDNATWPPPPDPDVDDASSRYDEHHGQCGNGADQPIPGTRTWPNPPDERALLGLPGLFVRTVAPHTEADPAALLVQFLVAAGNAIGRTSYYLVESTRHYSNEFALIVGDTSRARKGTSVDRVRRPFALIEGEAWAADCIISGLSSGEGLIWQVRDRIVRREPVKEKGRIVGYEEVEIDPGVTDKRMLVIEGEFSSTLRVLWS